MQLSETESGRESWRRAALGAGVVLAVGALLARWADGGAMLPVWAEALLQLPLLLVWLERWRVDPTACCGTGVSTVSHRRGGGAATDRWLTIVVMAGGAGLAIGLGRPAVFLTATTVYIAGALAADAFGRWYRLLDRRVSEPTRLLRAIVGPWLAWVFVATIVLSLPLATHSAVPDYRHNFWDHVLNSAFAAVSAGCGVGTTIYSLGLDYSLFGQAVLVLTAEMAGLAFAAVGLAIIRPFLHNAIRLRTVWLLAVGLQAVGVAVMWSSWMTPPAGGGWATGPWDQLWYGLVHSGSAVFNTGLVLAPEGLGAYLANGRVFGTVTTLAIVGSVGLPIIVDLIAGPRRRKRAGEPAGIRDQTGAPPWKALGQWETGAALFLLIAGALVLWFCETPWRQEIVWRLPDSWHPERPVIPESTLISLRDNMPMPRRWAIGVFVSATLRSAGLQSVAITQGTLSWPSYGLMLAWMFVGGSAGGVGGGLRTTCITLALLCLLTRRARWAAWPGGADARRAALKFCLAFVPIWLLVNAAFVGLIAAVSAGTAYERFLECTAACNSVGLSTGLSLHLTGPGRLVMMLAMIVGRGVPLAWWAILAGRFTRCSHAGEVPADDDSVAQ